MQIKAVLVDEYGNIEQVSKKPIHPFYKKPECPKHGRVYVHKSQKDQKFYCTQCSQEVRLTQEKK